MTWGAFIPGLREIRGPLFAGYLWLLAIWLQLGDRLPSRQTDDAFERLWEAGEAIGPIGRAAALSVVAYLIGALVNGAIRSSIGFLWGMVMMRVYRSRRGKLTRSDKPESSWLPVSELLKNPDEDWELHFASPSSTVILVMVKSLERAELDDARARVEGAVNHAEAVSNGSARYKISAYRSDTEIIALPRQDRDLVELPLPRFSPQHDILEKRSLLKTRLRELAPSTATKIEQFDYEAEFRNSLTAPLIALILMLSLHASLAWSALLIVPLALLLQARSLQNAATRELIDALRARSGTADLEKITPVFQVYRANAKQLEDALIHANWNGFEYPVDARDR